MKHWFKDRHFRSLLKNSSYLGLSRIVSAVAGVATLAFSGRGLGLELFGLLVVIHSYSQVASGLSRFQSWQLVVRYGGRALGGGEIAQFKAATSFALGLDLASGFGGMVVAITLLPLINNWFGLPDRMVGLAMLYCTLLPTMTAAAPNGVVRVLDRFDLISWQGTFTPISRAILTFFAWWLVWPFEAYVLIWYASDLGGDLFTWFFAWRELKRRDLLAGIKPSLRPHLLPGAWRFAIHVNLTSSLTSTWAPLARLIVGGLLGPASAALYRVAASLADSAQKPADLLARAYYPEVVRMDLATKHPWRLMKRAMVASGVFGGIAVLAVLIGGKPLLGGAFGAQFVPAYPILLILLGVPLLTIISFPLPSTFYALDRPDAPLKARAIAAVAYLLLVFPLIWWAGVNGAALAYLLANVVLVATLAVMLRYEYRKVRGR